jgi:hypothetical protein
MIKILALLLLATLLSANPKIYSALGDVVYDNVEKIKELKNIKELQEYESEIDRYVISVYAAKKMGFSADINSEDLDKKEYLNRLRKLSKTNDMFYKYVQDLYKESIEKEDAKLWQKLINSGLIDTQRYKYEILEFYFAHSSELDEQGVVKEFLDRDKDLKTKNTKKNTSILLNEEAQEDKIKSIRKKDKLKQEKTQKTLEDEQKKKKAEIKGK